MTLADLSALIVDDEEELTFLLSSVLEFNRFQVAVAHRTSEALSELKARTFDLIITDYKMEELDGFQFIREIRDKLALKDIRIILLTFRDFSEEEVLWLSTQNVTYLKKPFLPNELVQKIETLFI